MAQAMRRHASRLPPLLAKSIHKKRSETDDRRTHAHTHERAHAYNPLKPNLFCDKQTACFITISTLRRYSARTGKTEFIVNERGHLVKGMKRPHTAFVRPTTFHTNERWPVMSTFVSGGSSHTLVGVGSSATMGYKGIPSTYLPMGSVPIRTTSTCPGGFKPAHSHFFV